MKTHLLILLIIFGFTTYQAQNYRYLGISLRSEGSASRFSSNRNLIGQDKITELKLKPGFSVGGGIGIKRPDAKLDLQIGAGLSYYASDYTLTSFNAYREATVTVNVNERSDQRVLLEVSPSAVYAFPRFPIDLRFGLRSGLLLYSFGDFSFSQGFYSISAPNELGVKIRDGATISGEISECCNEITLWLDLGIRYWFSKNQDMGIELWGAISPSILIPNQAYDFLFGIHLLKRWDR